MLPNTNGDTKDMEEGECVCKRWPQHILSGTEDQIKKVKDFSKTWRKLNILVIKLRKVLLRS